MLRSYKYCAGTKINHNFYSNARSGLNLFGRGPNHNNCGGSNLWKSNSTTFHKRKAAHNVDGFTAAPIQLKREKKLTRNFILRKFFQKLIKSFFLEFRPSLGTGHMAYNEKCTPSGFTTLSDKEDKKRNISWIDRWTFKI